MRKYLVLIVVIIIIVALGYLFYFQQFSSDKITGLEVARKTALFLDSTLRPDGSTTAGFGCIPSIRKCQPVKEADSRLYLGQVSYGYYSLAKTTGDTSYRNKADETVGPVLDKCLSDDNVCARDIVVLAQYYFDTKEQKYLDAIFRGASEFNNMSYGDIVYKDAGPKLALLYQVLGDENYKKLLLTAADLKLYNWQADTENFDSAIQMIWSVLLPAHDLAGNRKYLEASEQFFNEFNLAKNFDNIRYMETALRGSEALISLAEKTGKSKYKEDAVAVLQEILDRNWDWSGSVKVNGDHGFLDIVQPGKKAVAKRTVINGWLVKLFIDLANENFKI